MQPRRKVREPMSVLTHVKTRLLPFAAALVSAAAAAFAADPPPDPLLLLQSVRMAQTSQHLSLNGDLRTGPNTIPFRLVIDGSVIRYEFDNPPNLLLRLSEKSSQLLEVARGGAEKVAPFDKKVRNSDVTNEDLALHFLYWREAKLAGEETLLTRHCWKVDVQPGAAESQYSHVLVWIADGALLQAEAYDKAGKLVRRFKVIRVQKIEGLWMLKEMRIEAPKEATPTYLEITGEEK
jgi:Outer membrane lipoprotein-sorting protein